MSISTFSSAGTLDITWMTQDATPRAIRELITCGCKTGCKSHRRCKCLKNGLQCSDVCKCPAAQCSNRAQLQQQPQGSSTLPPSTDPPPANSSSPEAPHASEPQSVPEAGDVAERADSSSGTDDSDSSHSSGSDPESSDGDDDSEIS